MPIDQATLGRRLRDARTNCGLSQDEVADELGLQRTAIVHIESGNRAVSTLELAEMARFYRRPVAAFFREEEDDVLTALGRISDEFKDDPKVQQEIERHVNLCQHSATLRSVLTYDAVPVPPEYSMSAPSSTWEAVQQGQSVAKDERRRLGLGDNPIPDVAELLTTEGVWASGTQLPDGISGMFLQHSTIGMVVLVNFGHPRARKRFSYAHEYAHSLLDRSSALTVSRTSDRDQLSEVRANAFAAAFLIPETGVKSFLEQRNKCGGTRESFAVYDDATEKSGVKVQASRRAEAQSQEIHYQLVAHLAYHFGVSYMAACYRLKSLKCINDEELKELLSKEEQALRFLEILKVKEELLGKDDPRKVKPDRELTVELLSLATEAYNRELISKAKLVELGALVDIERKDMLDLVGE